MYTNGTSFQNADNIIKRRDRYPENIVRFDKR